MSYSLAVKEEALSLRMQGYSVKEIARKLNIAVGTSSFWVGSIELDEKAQSRLLKRKILGQYKAIQTAKMKRKAIKEELDHKSRVALSKLILDKTLCKLLCSIFFWTEGGKFTDSYLYFMNSDPKMIEVFMKLLRRSFDLDEKKLRALVHIHNYHNDQEVKVFWSKLTKIPLSQFNKSYLKQNTKKRIRDGYQGCLRIRYYDSKIALELRSIYNAFAQTLSI